MFSSAASIIGKEIDSAFLMITGICIVLFTLIIFLTLYFVLKYSRRENTAPSDIEGSAFLETSWTVLSIILVLFMFYLGWRGYSEIRVRMPEDVLRVKVIAQQWTWSFEYENGKQSNVLNLPVNKPVKVIISARDVLHGFFVPAFRVKQDAVPGAENLLWWTPDKIGTYDIFCTQYCGLGHSIMLSKAEVMDEKKFNEWLESAAETKPTAEPAAPPVKPGELDKNLALKGEDLYKSKGCNICHSIDGSRVVGPTWKGLYGSKTIVVTNGKEREITADDEYIMRSAFEPNADVVAGFLPIMPSQKGLLKEDEIKAIIEYMKTLK